MNWFRWIASIILFFSCVTAQAQILDPARIALLKWYDANQTASFSLGGSPSAAVAFDGTHIWTAIPGVSGQVIKLRASDGAVAGTFTVSNNGLAIAFDGANIWLANFDGTA